MPKVHDNGDPGTMNRDIGYLSFKNNEIIHPKLQSSTRNDRGKPIYKPYLRKKAGAQLFIGTEIDEDQFTLEECWFVKGDWNDLNSKPKIKADGKEYKDDEVYRIYIAEVKEINN